MGRDCSKVGRMPRYAQKPKEFSWVFIWENLTWKTTGPMGRRKKQSEPS